MPAECDWCLQAIKMFTRGECASYEIIMTTGYVLPKRGKCNFHFSWKGGKATAFQ